MKAMIYLLIIFLAINFAGLAIGGIFTGKGVPSEWYQNLAKAPWTPPGWVFGAAWTTIMICFAVYMAFLWKDSSSPKMLIILFSLQWILNVIWSPVFFHYHSTIPGLVIIVALTLLVGFFGIYYYPVLKLKTLLILPYFVWLIIASSLNAYIVKFN